MKKLSFLICYLLLFPSSVTSGNYELSAFIIPVKLNLDEKKYEGKIGSIDFNDFKIEFPFSNKFVYRNDIDFGTKEFKENPKTQNSILKLDDTNIIIINDADFQLCEICSEISYNNLVLSDIFEQTPEFLIRNNEDKLNNPINEEKQVLYMAKKISFLPQNSSIIYKLKLDRIEVFLIGGHKSFLPSGIKSYDINMIFSINKKVIKITFLESNLDYDFINSLKNWRIINKSHIQG